MTLIEQPYALCFRIHAFSKPTTKTWIRCYQQRRCSPMTLVSGIIRFVCGYSRGFPEEDVKQNWRCRKRQFLVLSLAISLEALVVRPTLLYSRLITQSLAAFTLTPKYVTLSDHKGHFTLNCLLFRQVKFNIYGKRQYIYSRHHRRIAGGAWGWIFRLSEILGCRSEIFITDLYKKRTLYYFP